MKKLLSLLGSISIAASSLTIVGFSYANLVKSSIEAKVRNYLNISSLLARGTILSQKSSYTSNDKPVTTDGQDFSLRYASQYLYGKKMSTFFNHSQFENGDVNVLTYFGSMFNLPTTSGYVYTARENPMFELASPTLHLQTDDTTGKSGNDDTMGILSIISSGAVALLEKGFRPETSAPLIENLAAAGEAPILEMVENGTFQTIHDILGIDSTTGKSSLFAKLSESLNETDLTDIENITYAKVFETRQVGFWQGLAEILFSGTYDAAEMEKILEDIENNKESPSKMAAAAIPNDKDGNPVINVQANQFLIDGIIRILPYLRTIFNYIQSFSEISLPINQIQDYNHLFDPEKTNGVFMTEHLNTNYLNSAHVIKKESTSNPEIIQWVQNNDGSYHQVLNVQDLIRFFQELVHVDLTNDPHGYYNIRILSILMELPLKSEGGKADVGNPIFDGILEPLLIQLLPKLVPSIPTIIGPFIPQVTPVIRAVLTHNQNFWDKVDGAAILFPDVLTMLERLKTILGLIDQKISAAIGEIIEDVKRERDAKPPLAEAVYGQPFQSLFSGSLLPRVLKILIKHGVAVDTLEPLLGILKNLATLLTTNIEEVLAAFGLDITTLPIFLYGIKGKSLNDIMDTFADKFNIKLNNSLKDNQEFLFNLGVLDRIANSLNQTATLEFENEIPESVQKVLGDNLEKVNVIDAVLVAFAYNKLLKNVTIDGQSWTDFNKTKKYTFLLGTRIENDTSSFAFADDSLFAAIAKIYSNTEQDEENKIIQEKNAATVTKLIGGFAELVNWFNTTSIPKYIADVFDPYFDSKNWRTRLIKSRHMNDKFETATIEYFLYYTIPGTKETHQYQVKISRDPAKGNDEEWAELGTWKIDSINLKK